MPPEELLRHLQRRPFQPFRLRLTDGADYEIRHPEMMLLARHTAEIGIPGETAVPIADRIVTIALLHIVRVEPLEAAKAPGNGHG
jgi:hypothetical protein